jgi:hypothetical protein
MSDRQSRFGGAVFKRLRHLRAYVSYFLIAAAQFLSPAAAADPASKIDPPAWSCRHTREQIQAFGGRVLAQEPDRKRTERLREARLRRIQEGTK